MIPERLRPSSTRCARWPSASTRPGTGSTSSAGSSATCCSAGRSAGADIDLTTDARPDADQGARGAAGPTRCGTQGERFGTDRRCKKGDTVFEITTHRAEAYAPDSRKPEVVLRRRRRGRPVAARLHRQRHGPARHRCRDEAPELIDPFDGVADLAAGRCARRCRPRCPSPTTRCACCGRPGSSPATASRPTPSWSPRCATLRAPARDRVGRAHPRRARQAARRRRPEPPACGSSSTPAWPTCSCPSCRPCASSRTRSTATRTCSPTRSRWSPRRGPTLVVRLAALLHDVGKPKTRSIGPKGVSFHHHEVVGARMARDRLRALRYPNDESRTSRQLVYLHLRFHGYGDDGWTDSAVRRYVRDAGDAARRAQRAHPLRLHHPQRAQGAHAARRAWTRSRRASPSCASRRSCEAIRPDLDGQAGDGAPRHRARAASRRGARDPARGSASTRARSARRRPTAASTPGGPPARSPALSLRCPACGPG